MPLGLICLIVLALLIVAQIALTIRYGWKGLAFATSGALIFIFGAALLFFGWANFAYPGSGGSPPVALLAAVFLVIPAMAVLVAAMILAFFVNTE